MANVHRRYSVRYQGRFLGHSVESVKALSYRRVQDVDTLAERPRWAWRGRQLVLNFSLRLNCRRRRAVHVCAPTHTHALLIFLLKCSLAQNELYQHTHARTHTHTHTHTRLMALYPQLPRWAGTGKVKPIRILLKQETVSGSGISWATCKSASRSRQITMPVPHHSNHQSLLIITTNKTTSV